MLIVIGKSEKNVNRIVVFDKQGVPVRDELKAIEPHQIRSAAHRLLLEGRQLTTSDVGQSCLSASL